jgi:hypothetical protein
MTQQPKITKRKVTDYQPNPENHNQSNERGAGMIENSFRTLGAGRSLVVDRNGVIIAGNQSQEGAVNAGIQDVIEVETDGNQIVVVRRTDLDLSDKKGKARQLAYADNRTHEVSFTLDVSQVKLDIEAGLDLSGLYTDTELDILLDVESETPEAPDAQIDRAEELREKWQTERGQLWLIPSKTVNGVHRLLCGDSTNAEDVARVMGGERAKYGLHDPPYGINVVNVSASAIGGAKPFGKGTVDAPGKVAVNHYAPIAGDDKPFDPSHLLPLSEYVLLWGANYYADKLPVQKGWIVWDKKGRADWNDNFSDCELAWSNMPIVTSIVYHTWMGMVQEGQREKRYHPTQKPAEMIAKVITQHCKEQGVIIDFYAGSGSTMSACEMTKRICHSIELSPDYTAVILERMAMMGCEPYLEDVSE